MREPTRDEIEAAQELCSREMEICVANGFPWECKRIVEKRLWYEIPQRCEGNINGPAKILKTSGRFDVLRIHERRALILDGKTGRADVAESNKNLQLRRLAALVYLNLDVEEVLVDIVKPFGPIEPACRYTAGDLDAAVLEMEEDVRRSHDPNAKRIPGEYQCRYCRANNVCKERLATLQVALPDVSPPLPMVPAREWTPAQRGLFLEREADARGWLEDRKEEIKGLLEQDPNAAPGWCLKDGKTLETINNPTEVHKRFLEALGGSTEAFLKAIKVQKGDLKDIVREATGHKGKRLDDVMKALLAGCTEAHKCAPQIVRVK